MTELYISYLARMTQSNETWYRPKLNPPMGYRSNEFESHFPFQSELGHRTFLRLIKWKESSIDAAISNNNLSNDQDYLLVEANPAQSDNGMSLKSMQFLKVEKNSNFISIN